MNSNDLQAVMEFLASVQPEVSGRSYALPAGALKERLERLATGGDSDQDKAALCEEVRGHPEWIQWLAQRIKERRIDPSPPLRT